jgi:hypothetical protein
MHTPAALQNIGAVHDEASHGGRNMLASRVRGGPASPAYEASKSRSPAARRVILGGRAAGQEQ